MIGTKKIKVFTFRLVIVLILLLFLNITNINSTLVSSDRTITRSRGNLFETEPNDNTINANQILSTPVTIIGSINNNLTYMDRDYFSIALVGGGGYLDNLSVSINNLQTNGHLIYDTLLISIYGIFNNDLIHIKTNSYVVWNLIEDMYIYAFTSDIYYIVISAYTYYSDTIIDYDITVSIDQVIPSDYNQYIPNAEIIIGPIYNKSIDMDLDMFDWYVIASPDPENYLTNFSITIDITDSYPSQQINQPEVGNIYFKTEVFVLIYHEDFQNTYSGIKLKQIISYQSGSYFTNSIEYYEHTNKDKTYIGIYCQRYGVDEIGNIWVIGDNYCDGWVEYSILKIRAASIIQPILSGGEVTPEAGKINRDYIYNVTYYDANNDPPSAIQIKIDNFNFRPMVKRDQSDNYYVDGCIYEYLISGDDLGGNDNHTYRFIAKDKENYASGDNNIIHNGPRISNNIPPYVKLTAPETYILYEDSGVNYFNPDNIFEDPDNDMLSFFIWNETELNWTKEYESDIINITILENGMLKFLPKLHQHGINRIKLNANDGRDYSDTSYELEVIIISINHPPQIRQSFSSLFTSGILKMEEDTSYLLDLNKVFYDPIENEPLEFRCTGDINITLDFKSDGTVIITPHTNWFGMESLNFYANDGCSEINDTLTILILPVNDPPVLDHTFTQIVYQDSWLNITFTAYDNADGDKLIFSTNITEVFGLTEDRYSFNKETGELSFKPTNDMVGTHDIKVSVSDGHGGIAFDLIKVIIKNIPDPPIPVINSPQNGDKFLTSEKITLKSSCDDPDLYIPNPSEKLQYKWLSNINGLLGIEATIINCTLTPGTHIITLEVSDGTFTEVTSIEIEVLTISDKDTDGDKIPDFWEYRYELNPNDPRDANEDADGDGFTNYQEYVAEPKTDPRDPEDHPPELESEDLKQKPSGEDPINIILSLILIVTISIIVSIIIISFISNMKKKRVKALEEKENDIAKLKVVEKYKPASELQKIYCYYCGKVSMAYIDEHPFVIICPGCRTKGVIY